MTVSWTSYHEMEVTDEELREAVRFAKRQLDRGNDETAALHNAVDDLISAWEDVDYYSVTDEAYDQIKAAVKAGLSEN